MEYDSVIQFIWAVYHFSPGPGPQGRGPTWSFPGFPWIVLDFLRNPGQSYEVIVGLLAIIALALLAPSVIARAPEDELAKEMTHDLETTSLIYLGRRRGGFRQPSHVAR